MTIKALKNDTSNVSNIDFKQNSIFSTENDESTVIGLTHRQGTEDIANKRQSCDAQFHSAIKLNLQNQTKQRKSMKQFNSIQSKSDFKSSQFNTVGEDFNYQQASMD